MARRERVADRIIEAIEKTIQENKLKPGDRISSENELCRELDVSRASVREAIRILEVTGKVDVRQGKGVFLSNMSEKRLRDITEWLIEHKSETLDHLEVRLLLEPFAASRAVHPGNGPLVQNLRTISEEFERCRKEGYLDGSARADSAFHQAISDSCSNRTVSVLMKTLIDMMDESWQVCLITPERAEQTYREHLAVIEALEQQDASRVKRLMKDHLREAMREIKNRV